MGKRPSKATGAGAPARAADGRAVPPAPKPVSTLAPVGPQKRGWSDLREGLRQAARHASGHDDAPAPHEHVVDDGAATPDGAGTDDNGPLARVIDLWADPHAGHTARFAASDDSDEPLDWAFGPPRHYLTLIQGGNNTIELDDGALASDALAAAVDDDDVLGVAPPELVLFIPGTEPAQLPEVLATPFVPGLAPAALAPAAPAALEPAPLASAPLRPLPAPLAPPAAAVSFPPSADADGTALGRSASPELDERRPRVPTPRGGALVDDDGTDIGGDAGVAALDVDERLDGPHGQPTRWAVRALLLLATAASYVVLAAVTWMLVWATLPRAFGWQPIVITGESMEPSIDRGDIILARPTPTKALVPGAVITFDDPNRPGQLITHRIIDLRTDGSLQTRGDHNATPDPQPVPVSAVKGRAVLRLPYIGLPVVWIQHRRAVPLALSSVLVATALSLVARARRRAVDDDVDDVDDDIDEAIGDDRDEDHEDEHDGDAGGGDRPGSWPAPLVDPRHPVAPSNGRWAPPVAARAALARRRHRRTPSLIISRGIDATA